MPTCDHPNNLALNAVKKTIGRNNYFAKRKIGKLGNKSAGIWISSQSPECLLSFGAELVGGGRIILENIGHGPEKLNSSGWREAEPHSGPPARRASASAMTSSKLKPFPAAISCSPRARRRNS